MSEYEVVFLLHLNNSRDKKIKMTFKVIDQGDLRLA